MKLFILASIDLDVGLGFGEKGSVRRVRWSGSLIKHVQKMPSGQYVLRALVFSYVCREILHLTRFKIVCRLFFLLIGYMRYNPLFLFVFFLNSRQHFFFIGNGPDANVFREMFADQTMRIIDRADWLPATHAGTGQGTSLIRNNRVKAETFAWRDYSTIPRLCQLPIQFLT